MSEPGPGSGPAPVPGVARGTAVYPGAEGRLHALLDAPATAGPVLLMAAHPDDEVIGAGTLLQRGPDVLVAHVTDGAPRTPADALAAGFARREDYAAARREERAASLALCGIGPERLCDLGVADQEASADLVALTQAVLALLRAARPAVVLTHAYEGGHPDHDATAFAAHAALRLLAIEPGGELGPVAERPAIVEFTSYHAGPGGITVGAFLPVPAGAPAGGATVRALRPTAEERARRERMLDAHRTQARTVAPFRHAALERYRLAPSYRFTDPPHEGRLFYEHFDWGTTGARWRVRARDALVRLALEEPV